MADNDTNTTTANGTAKPATGAARTRSAASRANTRSSKASEDAMKKQITELKRALRSSAAAGVREAVPLVAGGSASTGGA